MVRANCPHGAGGRTDHRMIILSLPMRTFHLLASQAPNTCFVCKRIKLRTPYNEKRGVGQRLLWRWFPSKDQASEDGAYMGLA